MRKEDERNPGVRIGGGERQREDAENNKREGEERGEGEGTKIKGSSALQEGGRLTHTSNTHTISQPNRHTNTSNV